MKHAAPIGLLALIVAGACSNRAARTDAGPIWPDALFDATVDAAPADSTVDGPATDLRPDAPTGPGWQAASTVTAEDLHAVDCFSSNTFVVGDKGLILYRGAGAKPGQGFKAQKSPTSDDLYTVSFAGPGYGVVGGKGWSIYETKNLGTSWSVAAQCSAFLFDAFHALHVSTSTTGFGAGAATANAGGGFKYYSGYSWVCGTTTYKGETFYDVFRAGKSGWSVGDTGGKIYRTLDEGITWTSHGAGTKNTLRAVHVVGATRRFAAGDKGTIVVSTDAKGATWSVASSSPTSADLYDIHFFNDKLGWIVGDKGTILHTANGGSSWTVQPTGITKRLEGVCFNTSVDGWAVGEGGTILYTESGGK